MLDADRDFLPPFKTKTNESGYIGLGKLIDATVKLAAYSGDSRVEAARRHLVAETIQAQEPDGYIGIMATPHRLRDLWDVHEMGYLIYGLLADYQYFGEERTLAAARRAADYLVRRWPTLPADWCLGTDVAPHVAVTGLERTMLALHRQTGEGAYLDFTLKTRGLPSSRSKRAIKSPKLFFVDPGLSIYLSGYHDENSLAKSRELGNFFETAMFLHLNILSELLIPKASIFYWRTTTAKEVDFVRTG